MAELVLLGILAGIDNLQVAAAMSVAPMEIARRRVLLASFAACEILSPVAGVLFASTLQTRFGISFDGIAPLVVIVCGIAIVWRALREKRDSEPVPGARWILIGLPISLSFDNLLIGVSAVTLGHPALPAALVIGTTSAVLCVTGILAGARISRLIPERAELVSGCALIIIAASMWIRE